MWIKTTGGTILNSKFIKRLDLQGDIVTDSIDTLAIAETNEGSRYTLLEGTTMECKQYLFKLHSQLTIECEATTEATTNKVKGEEEMEEMIQPAKCGRHIKVDGSKLTKQEWEWLIIDALVSGCRIVPIKEASNKQG